MLGPKALALLVVVAVGGGGAPLAAKPGSALHAPPAPIFRQASISVSRLTAGGARFLTEGRHGQLMVHLRPGLYSIKAVANDEPPGQALNPPCGSPRQPPSFQPGRAVTILIRPGVRRVKVTVYCLSK